MARNKSQCGVLTKPQLHEFWPLDFVLGGAIDPNRTSWGKPYVGIDLFHGEHLVGIVENLSPVYIDPRLPLTFTSNNMLVFEGQVVLLPTT